MPATPRPDKCLRSPALGYNTAMATIICHKCLKEIPLNEIREHLETCGKEPIPGGHNRPVGGH